MPSTYAHYRFGQAVLAGLPEPLQSVIRGDLELCPARRTKRNEAKTDPAGTKLDSL